MAQYLGRIEVRGRSRNTSHRKRGDANHPSNDEYRTGGMA
jgi:hypothetical protein